MTKSPASLSALQQAGVTDTEFRSPNLWLREVGNASLLRIRSLQPESLAAAFLSAGIEIPASVGQSAGDDPVIMCLRPGDWLVFSETLAAGELHEKFQAANFRQNIGAHSAILDFSDGLAVLRVTGAAAPWLLAKLSALDFPGAAGSGQHCARTRMGQVAVVVNYHPVKSGATEFAYDLIIDRSIASYLWDLLLLSTHHADELAIVAG